MITAKVEPTYHLSSSANLWPRRSGPLDDAAEEPVQSRLNWVAAGWPGARAST